MNVSRVSEDCPPPDAACQDVLLRSWVFILSYIAGNLLVTLLTRYAEGAVYTSLVSSLQTPLGAIWWTCLFSQQPFRFYARFDVTAAYTVGGLAVMTPAVIVYNMLSIQEAKREDDERERVKRFNEALERETGRGLLT